MAKVTKGIDTRTVTTEVEVFNLSMTRREASTLLLVLRNVGGSSTKTARKYADEILYALRLAGAEEELNKRLNSIEETFKCMEAEKRSLYLTPLSLEIIDSILE